MKLGANSSIYGMCITFQIAAVLWWFYFSKIAELLDTVSGPIFLNSACTSIGNNLFNKIIYLLLVMQICVRQLSLVILRKRNKYQIQ